MNFDEIFILLLNTLDLSQAMSIGLFFSLVYRKKKSNLLYLGIFLIVIGLGSLISIIEQLGTLYNNGQTLSLPFNLYLIIPCFLFLYVQKTSILKSRKTDYLIFIPGILDIIFGIAILGFSDNYLEIQESFLYGFFQFLGIIYFPVIVLFILLKVRENSKLLKQQYSSVEDRELHWVGIMVVSILVYISLLPVIAYNSSDFAINLVDTTFWLLVTYWSVYNGLLQQTSKNLIATEPIISEPIRQTPTIELPLLKKEESVKPSEKSSETDSEKYKPIFNNIEALVKNETLFLNPELTISDIASRINEHPRLISTTINAMSQQNFNSYINSFRVEHAKKLLLSGRSKTINIESIGQESGFKSNSSFYSAFKKNINLTPLQFLKANEKTKVG